MEKADGADYNARLVQPVVRWLKENRGAAAVTEAARAAGFPPGAAEGKSVWLTKAQFDSFLEAARAAMPDEETFRRAAAWELEQAYGALRFVTLARAPANVLAKSVAAYPLVCGVDRPELLELTETSARVRYVGGPTSRLGCLLRQAQVAEVPRMWGLPRARIEERCCTGLGDPYCEYRVSWVRSASRWPVVVGALAAMTLVLALPFMHGVEGAAVMATLAGGAASLALEMARASRRGMDACAETEEALLRLAAQEAAARREAQEAVRARDEFMATAAHELRSPVAAMRLAAQAVAKVSEGQKKEAAERAVRAAGRVAALVDDMMAAGAAGAGRLTMARRPCDLGEVVREAAARTASQLEAAGCELEVEVRGDLRGEWDAGRVDQAVTNLLSNAARHAPGTQVYLSVEGSDGRAVIRACDRGPGVDQARIGQLFDRFERDRLSGGLGIGLWLVGEVARAHGGTAWASNRTGGGLCVTVELRDG